MLKPSLLLHTLMVACCSLVLLWTVPATADQPQADGVKHIYVCGCGPTCDCATTSSQPGNCRCGKPLVEKQVLKEDADKVYVCACPEDCKCGVNPADPTKCACGKELRAYPKPTGMLADCPHAAPSAAQPPCAGCPHHADCAGCPKMPAAGQQAPCAGCPKMPAAGQQAPCAGCPKMPAAK